MQREGAAAGEHERSLGNQPQHRIFPAAARIGVTPADRPFDPDHDAQEDQQEGRPLAGVPAKQDGDTADYFKAERRPRQ